MIILVAALLDFSSYGDMKILKCVAMVFVCAIAFTGCGRGQNRYTLHKADNTENVAVYRLDGDTGNVTLFMVSLSGTLGVLEIDLGTAGTKFHDINYLDLEEPQNSANPSTDNSK